MGVPDDATFGRLSIGGDKRWVWTFAGLGEMADPEKWRFRIYGECADVFSAGTEVLPPAVGGWEHLPVLGGQLVWTRPTRWDIPSTLRFIHGFGGFSAAGLTWSVGPGPARGLI